MQLLGVRFDNLNKREVLEKIEGFLTDGRQHYIVLPYADFLMEARKDELFRNILNQADLCLSDGVGPVLASRVAGKEALKGRITGVELIWALFAESSARPIFLFGAREGVAEKAVDKIRPKAPKAKIAGAINGYASDAEAIDAINKSKAEILLVGLGMPKQEKWISENLKKMPAIKLAIGVGGAFDFISGRVRRAPRVFQKIGLEWLWRFIVQPWRIKRVWRSVVVFSWLIFKEKINGRSKN